MSPSHSSWSDLPPFPVLPQSYHLTMTTKWYRIHGQQECLIVWPYKVHVHNVDRLTLVSPTVVSSNESTSWDSQPNSWIVKEHDILGIAEKLRTQRSKDNKNKTLLVNGLRRLTQKDTEELREKRKIQEDEFWTVLEEYIIAEKMAAGSKQRLKKKKEPGTRLGRFSGLGERIRMLKIGFRD